MHVSSILVIGSCVNYLDVADNIYLIEDFKLQKYQHQISINKKSNINWLKKRFIKKQVNTLFINELVNEQLEVINKDVAKINNAYINFASINENMTYNQINALAYIIRFFTKLSFTEIEINTLYDDLIKLIDE